MPHLGGRDVGNITAGSILQKQFFDRCAEANVTTRNAGHFDEAAIEKHNTEFGVEHAKTLRHLADRDGVQCE